MTNKKEFLGTAPVGKLLFRLALPTVVAQLINMLYNIIDRIYIGHMPENGDLALTGVGVCMPIIMIVSAFAALVSSGGAPRASIFMGKKDMQSAEKTLGGCFTLQIILSVILTVVLMIWNEELLLAFGASENTIGYATAYMNVYALGTIFVQLTLGMNAFVTAQGFTKISMFVKPCAVTKAFMPSDGAGLYEDLHVLGHHRCCCQYHSRSHLYLRNGYGCSRCGACYHHLAGIVLYLGSNLPLW